MQLLRILFPKWAERRRIAKLAESKDVRDRAYEDARKLCAAAGVSMMAASVGVEPELTNPLYAREVVADAVAQGMYRSEVYEDARDGALAGFAEFAEAQR